MKLRILFSILVSLAIIGTACYLSDCPVMVSELEYAIMEYGPMYGLDDRLIMGIRHAESDDGRLLWSNSAHVVSNQVWVKRMPRIKKLYAEYGKDIYACIGDCQVLYLSAYSEGYRGEPKGLLDVTTNIKYACKILWRYELQSGGYIRNTIAMYNAGKAILKNGEYVNKKYVDMVYNYYKKNGGER